MREIDMSTRAIAAATGTSIGTVHSELSRCSELNTTNPAPVVGVDGKACPSSQLRTASTALILGHDRRKNGQWGNPGGRGNKGENQFSGFSESAGREALAQAGIVLDELGPAHI